MICKRLPIGKKHVTIEMLFLSDDEHIIRTIILMKYDALRFEPWEVTINMDLFFKILLIIFSLGLILAVLLQKGKSAGLSGAISGGAEHLFGKQKARGLDLFLARLTMVLAVGFFVLSLIVSYVLHD
ncbi:Protein-export membrane protein SecG [Marinicrinis lubricantis]